MVSWVAPLWKSHITIPTCISPTQLRRIPLLERSHGKMWTDNQSWWRRSAQHLHIRSCQHCSVFCCIKKKEKNHCTDEPIENEKRRTHLLQVHHSLQWDRCRSSSSFLQVSFLLSAFSFYCSVCPRAHACHASHSSFIEPQTWRLRGMMSPQTSTSLLYIF